VAIRAFFSYTHSTIPESPLDHSLENAEASAARIFQAHFHSHPQFIASAPGRVNLIGEHTDYNGGTVLPAAINRRIAVAVSARSDRRVEVHAGNLNATIAFSLDELAPSPEDSWANYVRGVIALLHAKGDKPVGANLAIYGTVPRGGGLSSSAALEVAVAHAMIALAGSSHDEMEIALLCQKAEHEWAGVKCGIMDQCISAMGRHNAALFLDCRNLAYRHVPLPEGTRIVICDTGVKRALASSEYNTRRAECTAGVAILKKVLPGITSLRDVTPSAFLHNERLLDPVVRQRCRHVVMEIARVDEAVRTLESGDLTLFGKLMYESHMSLQHDYQVSCPELDAVVDICAEVDGVYGARMTGAGFGGCAICLARENDVPEIIHRIGVEYPQKIGTKPTLLVTGAEDGASVRPA
jgi:galactokinase